MKQKGIKNAFNQDAQQPPITMPAFGQLDRLTLFLKNHAYTCLTAEKGNLGRRGEPSFHPAKGLPAVPTTHNCHFANGSASSLNHLSLQRCQTNQNSWYASIWTDIHRTLLNQVWLLPLSSYNFGRSRSQNHASQMPSYQSQSLEFLNHAAVYVVM